MKQKNIIVAVALIKNEEGKILLQKRNDPQLPDAHGKWEFPGGGIDDESKENALQRECKEEIGCNVMVEHPLITKQYNNWITSDGIAIAVEVECFHCRLVDGCIPIPSNNEVSEIGWFTEEEIKGLATLPGITDFVKEWQLTKNKKSRL